MYCKVEIWLKSHVVQCITFSDNLKSINIAVQYFPVMWSILHRNLLFFLKRVKSYLHKKYIKCLCIALYRMFWFIRWVLCANHMEPVKGFLGRFLRRKLVEAEVRTGIRNNDLNKIIDWIPKVWLHINKFLETHSSSDVTIGK